MLPPSSRAAVRGALRVTILSFALSVVPSLPADAEEPAAASAGKEAGATVTANVKDGFSLASNDGSWSLKLRGYVQLDGRAYPGDPEERVADTLTLRRVRLSFEGKVGKRFGFRVMPDFAGGTTTLQDAYVDWKWSDAVLLRAGKLKAPFGLERLQSGTDTAFVERALPTALGPNRDLGVQLGGQLLAGRLEYAVGVFNGVADGASAEGDADDDKDVVARLFASPWKDTPLPLSGLSFGVAVSQGDQHGTPAAAGLAGYRTAGQQTFFSYRADGTAAGATVADGERFRISPQAVYFSGPLGLLLEHVEVEHDVRRGDAVATLSHEASQITGIWVLTGEAASLRWHAPKRPYGDVDAATGATGRGAVALVARYERFAADAGSFPTFAAATAVEKAEGWAVGVDWTLYRQTRILADYAVTSFDGPGASRPDERVFLARVQIGW